MPKEICPERPMKLKLMPKEMCPDNKLLLKLMPKEICPGSNWKQKHMTKEDRRTVGTFAKGDLPRTIGM